MQLRMCHINIAQLDVMAKCPSAACTGKAGCASSGEVMHLADDSTPRPLHCGYSRPHPTQHNKARASWLCHMQSIISAAPCHDGKATVAWRAVAARATDVAARLLMSHSRRYYSSNLYQSIPWSQVRMHHGPCCCLCEGEDVIWMAR